ncbi:hypothetical protein [Metallosphaera tengchongensis]|uniref:hypothetical protein n=1 Tax=Metallosphaera tengchongensis TaxID=1532350 RepID=UPI00157D548C|nr:hypothetical protein [Metallosphaera tengchongensis]
MESEEILFIVSGLIFLAALGVYLGLRDFTVGLILVIIALVWGIAIYLFMAKFWKED